MTHRIVMKKTLRINKGSDTSKLKVIAELLKDLPKELFEEVDRDDEFSKFFGARKIVAKESFEVTLIVKKLKNDTQNG